MYNKQYNNYLNNKQDNAKQQIRIRFKLKNVKR